MRIPQTLLSIVRRRLSRSFLRAGLAVVVLAAGGAYLITATQAATYGSAAEAESGTVDAPATQITSATASGGKAVRFGSTGSPIPSPNPNPPRTCTNPTFQTSERLGGLETNGYFVYNNMWNTSYNPGPQTLYACAFNNWYVDSNQTNSAGAVKTYPNVHKDFNRPLRSFSAITSTYSQITPNVPNGIWNIAYDIWMNGLDIEVMIWTDNYRQVPSGNKVATRSFGGRIFDVWRTGNNRYIAFVQQPNSTTGTVNIREMLDYLIAQGWLSADVELYQIGYGVEVVSTDGRVARFTFNDFSLTTN